MTQLASTAAGMSELKKCGTFSMYVHIFECDLFTKRVHTPVLFMICVVGEPAKVLAELVALVT